jgi:hypothetical protein
VSIAREPLRAAAPTVVLSDGPAVIRLELPAGPCCHAVARLVVGGLASRLSFAVEQIEDLQLAVEALLSRPSAGRTVTVELEESDRGLRARLGPFTPAPAERRRLQKMLRTLVEDADVQDSGDREWIVLQAARSRPPVQRSA